MSVTQTRTDLVSTFLSEWTDTPISTENTRYEPTGAAYVFIQIAPTITEQPCLGRDSGQTWERDLGDCLISVFVPVNGAADGLALADKARRKLSQRRIGQTITGVGYVTPAGISPDQRYYLYIVRLNYRTDNIKEA